jgi:NAD(P)-dependent dehydrogenase (short-subunit alcohol dehydrogenase family)
MHAELYNPQSIIDKKDNPFQLQKDKTLIVITGISLNEAKVEFVQSQSPIVPGHTPGKKAKCNVATATAINLFSEGYSIYVMGSCIHCLEHIAQMWLKPIQDKFRATQKAIPQYYLSAKHLCHDSADILEEIQNISLGKKIHIIHFGAASETKVELPNNNLFLDPMESPEKAVSPLIEKNIGTLFQLLHTLKPILQKQDGTKLIVITALTALRTKRLHTLDAIQKGAMHAMLRSLALDLTKEKIFVTEVMPGITDTGFYDNPEVLKSLFIASEELGYTYTKDTLPLLSPFVVGDAVVKVLEFPAHVREISFIPFGQYPHMGA